MLTNWEASILCFCLSVFLSFCLSFRVKSGWLDGMDRIVIIGHFSSKSSSGASKAYWCDITSKMNVDTESGQSRLVIGITMGQ